MRRLERWIGWPAVGGWLLVLTALSSIPNAAPPHEPAFPGDKIAHVIVYGVLGVLLYWTLLRATPAELRARTAVCVVATIVLAVAWGGLDETYQRLIPGRDPSWSDLAADAVGAALGAAVAAMLWPRFRLGSGSGREKTALRPPTEGVAGEDSSLRSE